jgi:hypothetical protein
MPSQGRASDDSAQAAQGSEAEVKAEDDPLSLAEEQELANLEVSRCANLYLLLWFGAHAWLTLGKGKRASSPKT